LDEPALRQDRRAAMTSLAPVPSESQTCANCSAPLVADQRYCLSCGQPVSPVRLAFLDVLETERQPQLGAGQAGALPVAYTPYLEPAAGPAWLRRYAPLFGVLSVLLLAMIVGLLVGHWVTQSSKAPVTAEVVKVEGLGALATGVGTTTPSTSTTGSASTTDKSASSSKSEEQQEEAEAKAEEKAEEKAPAKAPKAKKVSAPALTKLEKSHGATHEKELSKLSTAPIEVK
jgi:hypothetical protein